MGPREQRESGGPINFAYHIEEGGVAGSALTSHTYAYGQVSEPCASFDPLPETAHLYLTRIYLKTPPRRRAGRFPSSFNLRLMLVPLGSRGDNYSSSGNVRTSSK